MLKVKTGRKKEIAKKKEKKKEGLLAEIAMKSLDLQTNICSTSCIEH